MSSPGTRTSTGGGNKEGAKRWEEGGHTWMAGSGRRRGRPARSGGRSRGKIKNVFFASLGHVDHIRLSRTEDETLPLFSS
jgi:hypothetical protein